MKTCSNPNADPVEQQINSFLSGVKHRLLVMSGKGGVGKSTVAANLAVELSNRGYKVGLLDVDMHGPTIAGLLGLTGFNLNTRGGMIEPFAVTENLKVITIQGFLDKPDDAVIWRGPIKIGVVRQLLSEVNWGPLDFLIVDSPPGTGDEPLTIAQTIPDCQAVIVTTPQEIALADVRKSLTFCQRVGMKVLGIVENMSGFKCPTCGSIHHIFREGGGEKTAAEWGISFLGRVPIEPAIVEAGDRGMVIGTNTESASAYFGSITETCLEKLGHKEKGAENPMKIGIPMAGEKLCRHFGHCEQFAIVMVENRKITRIDNLTPPPHEPGVIPAWLARQGVSVVLAGGMGERAQDILRQNGIEVVCGAPAGSAYEVAQSYLDGSMVTTENACSHDGHEHHCGG